MASPFSASISDVALRQVLRLILQKCDIQKRLFEMSLPEFLTLLDRLRLAGWISGRAEKLTLAKPAIRWLCATSADPAFPWMELIDEGGLDVRQRMAFPPIGQRTKTNVFKRISVQAVSTATGGESPSREELGFEP